MDMGTEDIYSTRQQHTRNNQMHWSYKCCDVVTFQSLIVETDSSWVSVVR